MGQTVWKNRVLGLHLGWNSRNHVFWANALSSATQQAFLLGCTDPIHAGLGLVCLISWYLCLILFHGNNETESGLS